MTMLCIANCRSDMVAREQSGSTGQNDRSYNGGFLLCLVKEAPLWAALLVWSFLPTTCTPWIELLGLSINVRTALLIGIASFYLARIVLSQGTYVLRTSSRSAVRLAWLLVCMVSYAAISTTWANLHPLDLAAMRYTLVATAGAFLLAYCVLIRQPAQRVEVILQILTLFLAFVSSIYAAESFFSMGLRSYTAFGEFGIQRVRGPLFGPSSGHFILLPALAFALQQAELRRQKRLFWLLSAFAICVALLGSGSRAAFLGLGLFVLATVIGQPSWRRKLRTIGFCAVFFAIVCVPLLTKVNLTRLRSFSDSLRTENALTVYGLMLSRSPVQLAMGTGYGAVWPWYIPDTEGARATGQFTISTQHGLLLYQPHSTPLQLAVELGLVGGVFWVGLGWSLINIYMRSRRRGNLMLSSSLIAVYITMAADLAILRLWELSAIWWLYMFGLMLMCRANTRGIGGHGNRSAVFVLPGHDALPSHACPCNDMAAGADLTWK